jgi:general secretion pathway protein A
MSLKVLSLQEEPFAAAPDTRFLYRTGEHRQALLTLWCGIQSGQGFMALFAGPGMGKTTVLLRLRELCLSSAHTAFLGRKQQCDVREFLSYLVNDLGIHPDGGDLVGMCRKLKETLTSAAQAGRRYVVFVDEAHNLDDPTLKLLRLIPEFDPYGTPRF